MSREFHVEIDDGIYDLRESSVLQMGIVSNIVLISYLFLQPKEESGQIRM